MVLSERNTGDIVRNGRRSRGPSPNTHSNAGGGGAGGVGGAANTHNASGGIGGGGGGGGGGGVGVGGHVGNNATANDKATAAPGAGTPESSDDDNSTKRNGKSKAKQSEYEEKIRVGRDYQAVCPQLVAEPDRRPELMNERALLVWSPTKEIPDMKLEEYISVAKEKYGYNGEQALGMLFWHKHDLERAVMDLANFTPFPDEWTTEDKVLFEQAFQFHGKSFHRIRQMLPDKSIASLVKYYYSWKKTRHRSSAMDRQEKIIKAAVKEGSENGSEVGSNEESDNDDKIQKNRQMLEQLEKDCSGDAAAANLDESGESKMAAATEAAGATTQATAAAAAGATATAAATTAAGNASTTQHRITARWTQDEISMAMLALRDYGKNFPMIAKVVGTKTEAHVRTFYMSYRRRYNLDQIVKEYEASTAKDEAGNLEQEQSSDAAAATGTTATAAVATVAVAGAANDASSQEVLAKKDESTTNNSSKKQKPELNAAKNSESAGAGVGATTGAAAAATANAAGNGTGASKATTITIADESDTATSSSSDVVNNSTALTNSSNSTSSLSGISSGGAPAKSSSSSSTSLSSSTSTNNNHNNNEAADNSVETTTTTTTTSSSSLKSTLAATSKRDNSDLNTADLPPAKKMALTVSAEFLAK
ncbi:REST corepressor isoform X3 [Drosophila nasuta]|uniref:REST corepressor isoform X3 n=1 Tax=Drosophila nasuta TaxID=42062 RepID=UPI00295E449E|nr:REST corepressor isoform X3 [Drosophila nasuta]